MSRNDLFDKVFIMNEGINYPKDLDKRSYAVIYPADGYYLSEKQHKIIQKGLQELGLIEKVFGTDIEFIQEDVEINNEEVREILNFDYSIYKKDTLLFDNCIYDSEFKWSISIFQDY